MVNDFVTGSPAARQPGSPAARQPGSPAAREPHPVPLRESGGLAGHQFGDH